MTVPLSMCKSRFPGESRACSKVLYSSVTKFQPVSQEVVNVVCWSKLSPPTRISSSTSLGKETRREASRLRKAPPNESAENSCVASVSKLIVWGKASDSAHRGYTWTR